MDFTFPAEDWQSIAARASISPYRIATPDRRDRGYKLRP